MSPDDADSSARAELIVLLVDEDSDDRAALARLVQGLVNCEIFEADTAQQARDLVEEVEGLNLYLAALPEAGEESPETEALLEFGKALHERFTGHVVCAYCSEADLTPYALRVMPADRLYYKPIDDAAMRDWLHELFPDDVFVGGADAAVVDAAAEAPEEMANPDAARGEALETKGSSVETLDAGTVTEDFEAEPVAAAPEERDYPPGTRIGDYELLEVLKKSWDTTTYAAHQTAVDRKVALRLLHQSVAAKPARRDAFLEEARAQALVDHPDIAPVYDATSDAQGVYYALELIKGKPLNAFQEAGGRLKTEDMLEALETCAGALEYLYRNQKTFHPLDGSSIYRMPGGKVRVSNTVTAAGAVETPGEARQIKLLGETLAPLVLPARGGGPDMNGLLARMTDHRRPDAVTELADLQAELAELAKQVVAPISAEEREMRTNRNSIIVGISMGALIVTAGIAALIVASNKVNVKSFDFMMYVPAGSFEYQDGQTAETDEFWIDEYEVTIAQYAAFLNAVAADPGLAEKVRHEDQPESKGSYVPEDWEEIYEAARDGGDYKGVKIDLNCPVFMVDWWDAHAYATWKGRRLPTEKEWEKAARGRNGELYPWGDELDTTRFNSAAGTETATEEGEGGEETSAEPPKRDPYRGWSPVDAMPQDVSRYNVKGMAGNVTEWTNSWDTDPDFPDRKVPIRRGASFANSSGFELTIRRPASNPEERQLNVGFRTASSEDPEGEAGGGGSS